MHIYIFIYAYVYTHICDSMDSVDTEELKQQLLHVEQRSSLADKYISDMQRAIQDALL